MPYFLPAVYVRGCPGCLDSFIAQCLLKINFIYTTSSPCRLGFSLTLCCSPGCVLKLIKS